MAYHNVLRISIFYCLLIKQYAKVLLPLSMIHSNKHIYSSRCYSVVI